MELLTVDAPQDAIHLLKMMEQEGSPDISEARELISSMKGECSAGIRVAYETQEGHVYPCQYAQTPESLVGSIRNRPFSELWNAPDNPVLVLFRNKQEHLSTRCGLCSYLDLCLGGAGHVPVASGEFSEMMIPSVSSPDLIGSSINQRTVHSHS